MRCQTSCCVVLGRLYYIRYYKTCLQHFTVDGDGRRRHLPGSDSAQLITCERCDGALVSNTHFNDADGSTVSSVQQDFGGTYANRPRAALVIHSPLQQFETLRSALSG